jgi:hypothetical protein
MVGGRRSRQGSSVRDAVDPRELVVLTVLVYGLQVVAQCRADELQKIGPIAVFWFRQVGWRQLAKTNCRNSTNRSSAR